MNNNQKLQLNHLKQSRRHTLFSPKMVLEDEGCFRLSVFSVASDFFHMRQGVMMWDTASITKCDALD